MATEFLVIAMFVILLVTIFGVAFDLAKDIHALRTRIEALEKAGDIAHRAKVLEER